MTSNIPTVPETYDKLLAALKQRIRDARLRTAIGVNRELLLLYWRIGNDILRQQQAEGWGTKVIDRLAADLRRSFPEMTGMSPRNLKYMRAFAEAWPDEQFVQQVAAQLPWGHTMVLLDQLKAADDREWYTRQAAEHGWSRAVLSNQIASNLRGRTGAAMTNFDRTLPAPQSELAQQLIKDPYAFDFLGLGPEISERELEQALIDQLRAFILELGKGFAFIGSQYPLEVGGQDYFLDLLFFHYRLNCFVVIELKVEPFRPEFAGKMNFYLSAVDDQLRQPHHQPSIGIILCQDRNEVIVEYALRDSAKPMGVAKYQLLTAPPQALQAALPTPDELAREFPHMALVGLRIEIERALLSVMNLRGIAAPEQAGIANLVRALGQEGISPTSAEPFMAALRTLNAAAHGREIDTEAADEAEAAARRFLAELHELGPDRN